MSRASSRAARVVLSVLGPCALLVAPVVASDAGEVSVVGQIVCSQCRFEADRSSC